MARCHFRPPLSAPGQPCHPWLSRIQQRVSRGDGGVGRVEGGGVEGTKKKTTPADESRAAAD